MIQNTFVSKDGTTKENTAVNVCTSSVLVNKLWYFGLSWPFCLLWKVNKFLLRMPSDLQYISNTNMTLFKVMKPYLATTTL